MDIKQQAKLVKLASPKMAGSSEEQRNNALNAVVEALKTHREQIFEANKKDLEQAARDNVATPIVKRLKFDETKLRDVIAGIQDLVKLPDPLFRKQMNRQLDEGLTLVRETCPIGVIGVIFEARPDALIQISALCIKSGNCVILKGGSETMNSNRVLFQIIYDAVTKSGMPENCMLQLEARSEISELLTCNEHVDLLIPRGSNAFVQYIMNNTKIPVMGHADGICHIYVDKDANMEKAIPIIIDAKTQYVSACNAVETLLIHKDIADEFVPKLYEILKENHVELRGSEKIVSLTGCEESNDEDDKTEYLDLIVSAKEVDSMEKAIDHINYFGSHHTDCIITEDKEAAEYFMKYVDSAGVYQNCSTRFADGYRYGFGAEVGISTSKIHARGPVGLEGLVSYKYKLYGSGNIVDDYAKGKSAFHFKDL
ncbi:MAG: glutamate-5-semialdehyde dehydrogenase [Eubacterium sp.]|nr:glutamate-5-semialdehyde dehydrogenase [Eubacterium sp.]